MCHTHQSTLLNKAITQNRNKTSENAFLCGWYHTKNLSKACVCSETLRPCRMDKKYVYIYSCIVTAVINIVKHNYIQIYN